MTDTDDFPRWIPRSDLSITDLANALEIIRRAAWAHWWGGAFEPKHMHAISCAAAQALCGEPMEAPVDMTSPEYRQMCLERAEQWEELCDDEVEKAANYEVEAADNG